MTTEASKEFEEIQNHSHAALSGRAESYLTRISQMKFSFGYNKTSFGHISKGFS
jgi:hypothetical protein